MAVDDARYAILCDGTLVDGCTIDSAKRQLAQLLRLDDTALAQLFSGRLITLKAGLDKQRALTYQQALRRAGVQASLAPSAANTAPQPPAVMGNSHAEATCPRCAYAHEGYAQEGCAQEGVERCARCHMDLRRHWARQRLAQRTIARVTSQV